MIDSMPILMQSVDEMQITIYTDGACDLHAENRPGGWAAILRATDDNGKVLKETVISGGAEHTTNNQMELTAVVKGLKVLKRPTKVTIVTDSRYVMDIATGVKQVTRNKNLWQMYISIAKRHEINWQYVAGHSGDGLNERCDRLAVKEKRSRANFHSGNTVMRDSAPETDVSIYISTVVDSKKRACAFAVQVIYRESAEEISDSVPGNSELKPTLMGAIRALESLRPQESATIYTSQEYLAKGMSKWVTTWAKNGWKTKDGRPVKHQMLWQKLRELSKGRVVYFEFVKSRKSIPYFQIGKEIAASVLQRN